MVRTLRFALVSLVFNMAFSAYYIVFGIFTHSWWLFTIGVYYAILSAVRFAVLRTKDKNHIVVYFTGIMLMVLSLPLVSTVILSFVEDRGAKFHQIAMIAIAVYTFSKMTIATVNFVKSRQSTSAKLITLRNISFADAFVSIFSLQRSMLVSFEGMTKTEIQIMNLATGSAVCIIVFLLGLNLMRNKKILFKNLE